MGFIRVQTKTKNGKKYQYFYYSERRRSKVKDGGDGKVRSIDRLLGNYINGQYLSFHLWDGLNVVDFAEAMIVFELKNYRLDDYIQWEVTWKFRKGKPTAGKLKFRAKSKAIDARTSSIRKLRKRLQSQITWILENTMDSLANGIEDVAYHLASYTKAKDGLTKAEERYREWKRDPSKKWTEGGEGYEWHPMAGDLIQSNIESSRLFVDYHLSGRESIFAELLTYCPPGERERFKAAIIRKSETLAADPTFLDRHLCK